MDNNSVSDSYIECVCQEILLEYNAHTLAHKCPSNAMQRNVIHIIIIIIIIIVNYR